jgi:hypothetical protein
VPGDWVCLYVPGKGILGHAQLTAIIDAGASVVRHSERFRRVFGLEHVDLYAEAVVPPVDIEQALTSGLAAGSLAGLFLEPVSREEFSRMTDWKERPSREDVPKEESKSA